MVDYPKDWYRHLIKGDVVKCIKVTGRSRRHTRIPGHEYTIVKHSKGEPIIRYAKGLAAAKDLSDFIPIKMAAFPDLKQTIKHYSIW